MRNFVQNRAVFVSFAALAMLGSAAAAAQQSPDTPPAGDSIRLTDEQRLAILETNTPESAAAVRGEAPGSTPRGPGIHGEVGAMIGTNGTRGAYGAAEIPLGDHAAAAISIESSRSAFRR